MVVDVINLDECLKKFKDISGIDLSEPIKDATIRVQNMAKYFVPKDTHTLEHSIHRSPIEKRGYNTGGKVSTTVEYGIYQEFGTRKMRPRPFMRPAVQFTKSRNLTDISNYIKRELKKHGRA